MNSIELKLAQQIGALILENIKLAAVIEDLREQLEKAKSPPSNGVDNAHVGMN